MMSLMFSISGLRGIVGKDLTSEVIYTYASAFGRYVKQGRIVVGRDARKSGKVFLKAVIQGLHAAGCRVIDLGIVPTPTVLFMVRRLKANGGIIITASHNPIEWNALKFVSADGIFLNQREFTTFSRIVTKRGTLLRQKRQSKSAAVLENGVEMHIGKIMSVVKPPGRRFRVGVDAVNGAGSIALPLLLERMGCIVYRLNCRFRAVFPRNPEPTPGNIKGLCHLVKDKNLDMGFACDPDCDRLSLVDENGRAIGEENTLVLATDFILSKKRGNVVTNLSTTAIMDYITNMNRCRLYRTKVGEANVVSKMRKIDAVIGGEGNGGVIYPRLNFTRDALVGAALITKLLAERGQKLSEIITSYPHYYMIKKKIRIQREKFEKRRKRILMKFKGRLNLLDGVRITTKDYWLHIRPSQTEPLVRIIGESHDKRMIERCVSDVATILK
jgi:phosphomannomutase